MLTLLEMVVTFDGNHICYSARNSIGELCKLDFCFNVLGDINKIFAVVYYGQRMYAD